MKKRILAAVIAGLMVVSMAAGCAKPKVTLGQYKGLEVTDVSQAELEAEMKGILESHAELVAVDRPAAEGDTVNIDYVGKLDGVAFEGGTAEDADLELGSNSFIDGFEDGLIGATKGQTLDLNLTFPDPYTNNPDLAGKAVVFTVTVNEVKETQIPEWTDEFAKENYEELASTAEELKQVLLEEMQMDAFYTQLTEKIMANCTVENVPADDVADRALAFVNRYTTYAQTYASMYGVDAQTILYYMYGFESTEALQKYAQEYAAELVKNELVLKEIANVENITVSDELYKQEVAEYAEYYGYDSVEEFEKDNKKADIEFSILAELVMEFLVDEAVIVPAKTEAE